MVAPSKPARYKLLTPQLRLLSGTNTYLLPGSEWSLKKEREGLMSDVVGRRCLRRQHSLCQGVDSASCTGWLARAGVRRSGYPLG